MVAARITEPSPAELRPVAPTTRTARTPVLPLTLTHDGRLANPTQVERLTNALIGVTDCFVFCDGGLFDEAEARVRQTRFFALLEQALAPLGERIAPLGVGLHWPSRLVDDAITGGVWPALQERTTTRARERGRLSRLLVDLCRAEIPAGPEEEAELDFLLRGLKNGPEPDLFHAFSTWVMKRRAGAVGERLGRELLAPLWRATAHPPRLHLVGHSFGATLVTSAILGGARPGSVTLLLGAFSAFAFTPQVPGFKRPGFYHRVVDERRVQGSVVVLRSEHDVPVVRPSARRRVVGQPASKAARLRKRDALLATSTLATVGARGVGAPELDLVDVQQTGISAYPVVNIDGTRIIRARDGGAGTELDIFHSEVATLVAMAAGLLVGGPERSRPRPLDPLIRA